METHRNIGHIAFYRGRAHRYLLKQTLPNAIITIYFHIRKAVLAVSAS